MALPQGNVPVNENEELRKSITDLQVQVQNLTATIQEMNVHQDSDKDDSDIDGSSINNEENTQWELGFKVEIPKFHGGLDQAEELLDWFVTVEEVMDFKKVPNERRVSLVATCFRGRAAAWWNQLKASRARSGNPKIATWEELKKHLRQGFLPCNYDQILSRKLQDLHQGNKTVDEYATKFFAILSRIEVQDTETQLVARFIGGLNPQLQCSLNFFRHLTVYGAQELASILEQQERGSAVGTVPEPSKSLVRNAATISKDGNETLKLGKPITVASIVEYFCFGFASSVGVVGCFGLILITEKLLKKD
ncbi:Retrotransposon gag domain [Arabidopsis thaliana x Arabidopsis arenosa]|uniref:Retrotransposon gag domain n=1 Tax=Arabidopsis thaliana x Arabidopsis arenosa TaxID=1240361 RepID=A0A8T1Z2D1_9BRAS|nr:Retrotransposon gag domain [Arabidopsis thaliana x Arabidopsis arenosa]